MMNLIEKVVRVVINGCIFLKMNPGTYIF